MIIKRFLLALLLCTPTLSAQADTTSEGAEIVSYNTFGEGLMVTRAKMAPISGTVSNIFFYNRADEPWNGNIWYEYDWELRGAYPTGGWAQIRVREENGGQLKDAPVNVTMTENIGEKFLHYILLRQGSQYVYDVRESFNINSYDYTISAAHGGNSASIIAGGPRIYFTGGSVGDIPATKRLDFSLGITSFDNGWAGALPNEAYSGDYAIDFTRFYEFSGNNLNTTPQWQDEFNNGYLDYGKWFAANWTYGDTLFTPENIRFENGYMILRVDRGQTSTGTAGNNLAIYGEASQSTTSHGGSASRAIDGDTSGAWKNGSVTHTANSSNSWWEVELAQNSNIDQIVIYNRTDCCTDRLEDFSVSVLDDNDNVVWTQIYTAPPSPSLTINLDSVGKKVKINLNGTLSLAEVEVYGTSAEPAQSVNLALSGTASQSTTGYGGSAERAIDDNTNGVWKNGSVTHTSNTDAAPWWQVELAQSSNIEEIVVYNRSDNCCVGRLSNFTVSVLDDSGNVVWSQLYADAPSPSLAIDLDVTGKTVRVELEGNRLSLAEVQVIGTAN
ncbi:hypothetical protein EOL70_15450 [Leucothrix sargassi]|nr:hypothetical protein EOL70_15450 [Leucothrix sargassi]